MFGRWGWWRGWYARTECGVTAAAVELLLRVCRPSKMNKGADAAYLSCFLTWLLLGCPTDRPTTCAACRHANVCPTTGAADAEADKGEGDDMEDDGPPLIAAEVAGPMLLTVANTIKVSIFCCLLL